jgi:hypothetical protein
VEHGLWAASAATGNHPFIHQITTFNTAAKLTHAKYGTSRPLAEENDESTLLGRFKAACGVGGTVKDDVLEICSDVIGSNPGVLHVITGSQGSSLQVA